MPNLRRRLIAAALSAPLLPTLSAGASDYPTRTVRILSGFSPGGANDVLARLIAEPLGERLKQAVIVENRVGAGGTIAAEVVANAAPDGHTLLMLAVAHCAHGALYPKLRWDVQRDFTPVSVVATQPIVLAVSARIAATDLKQFIALAKSKPGQLFYGSGGAGTSQHMAMEMFKLAAGIDVRHVPYKGLPPALPDLFSGQLSAIMLPISTALSHLPGGKLRVLGIARAARSKLLPQVPTLAEAGIRGVEADAWHGIVAPRATAPAIVARLQREIAQIVATPAAAAKLQAQGAEAVGNSAAQFAAFIAAETLKYRQLIAAAKISVE